MKAYYIVCVLIWLAGCAGSPTHHSLSKVEGINENLLPPRDFIARMPKTGGYSLSPDGTKMTYWERSFMVPYVFPTPLYIENLATGQLQKYSDLGGARRFHWSGDSKTIIYNSSRKQDGTYYNQLIARDITTTEPNKTSLVPQLSQKADLYFYKAVRDSSTEFIAKLYTTDKDGKYNNPAYYRINYKANSYEEIAASDSDIYDSFISDDGLMVGRSIKTTSGFDIQWAIEDGYRVLFSCEDWSESNYLGDNEKSIYFLSNCLSDKVAVYRIDKQSYKVETLYELEVVDIEGVAVDIQSNKPLFATVNSDSTELALFDKRFSFLRDWFQKDQHSKVIFVKSYSDSWDKFILTSSDLSGRQDWLINASTQNITPLNKPAFFERENQLGYYQSIEIPMEGDVPVRAFLARPSFIAPDAKIPTVVYVHGGPRSRSYPMYDPQVSFLINRGYAVLVVNYYGSTGYGKSYSQLPVKNFALLPASVSAAVDWLIDSDLADPDKLALMGSSYGGYLALLMPSLDNRFACSIAINPVTDLNKMAIYSKEKFGEEVFNRSPFARYHDVDLNTSYKKWSPINQTDYSDKKILLVHAEDDRRVPLEQSTEFYKKFDSTNEINFITLPHESHGLRSWTSRLRILRENEKFLAKCLGGANGGFDYYSLAEPLRNIYYLF